MAIASTGLLLKGAKLTFMDRLEQTDKDAAYKTLCTEVKSDNDREHFRWLGSVPPMREWGTGRVAKGLRSESYDVINERYEATLEIDRNEVADDQVGAIRIRIEELAVRAANHKDSLLAALMVNGATSGYNSYDGVTFWNASHERGDSGAQSNALTPAATDADAPTTAEWRTALGASISALLSFTDDQGEPMNNTDRGLVACVPPSMYLTALEAISASVIGGTTNVLSNACRVIVMPRLTATDTWYLYATAGVIRPFVFVNREPIEFKMLGEGSEEDFLREKWLAGVRARYAVTYGEPLHAIRNVFTAS